MKHDFVYQGKELELFSQATNWKRRVSKQVLRFVKGEVAEIGPGPGNFTPYLFNADVRSWTYVEPDATYAAALNNLPVTTEIIKGTINDLPDYPRFDTIIYLDVLEHIQDDRREIRMIMDRLKPGGIVIVLCPAFNFLYSPFDREIGHHRRYTRRMLGHLFGPPWQIMESRYLDSAGFLASLSNRLLLKQKHPRIGQILFWDRVLVKISGVLDLFFSGIFGRSVLVIAKKNTAAT
jgi:SAM-dependent methyltransferase